MSKQLGGVLAARYGWCRPDEVIRLAVPCDRSSIRFDIGGLSWEGEAGGQAVAEGADRMLAAVDDLVNASSDYDSRTSPPKVVYFGSSPQAQVMHAASAAESPETRLTWVLTSHRIALLEEVPESAEDVAGAGDSIWQKARKFGAGVRDFSRDVVDILQDKKLADYEPNIPIPVSRVAVRTEFPAQHVRSIGQTARQLPAEHAPRKVFALRIELTDGSGVEVIAQTDESIARLQAMAFGHQ
ncbi:hypothetical protein [Saccharopolyspora shandongensis]|uniref:hypothetical protein n=1 Tax=Saccharopolyspora shandongensis TaxID=418495 RepID=UPI00340FB080